MFDPVDLNAAIWQDFHRTPTVEEVAHEFAGSQFTLLYYGWPQIWIVGDCP